MHKGFEIKIDSQHFPIYRKNLYDNYFSFGEELYNQTKSIIEKELSKYKLPDGSLDGSLMQANWFPQIKADIFISHSHNDKDFAISLAGWLNKEFGLTAFIDSCIWGFADNLLKLIDDEYCSNKKENKIISYNYKNRNFSTSHVHMMLSTALSMMIDETECVFFLNTPNSITPDDVISKTHSPWIYSELAMTRLIRERNLSDYRSKVVTEMFSAVDRGQKNVDIKYIVNTDHLIKIKKVDLNNWKEQWPYITYHSPNFRVHALDKLYEITNK